MQKRYFPLCQNTHIKNESPNYIIDYEQKYFYCEEHAEKYSLYCETCKMNICLRCENSHNNHQIISYGKMLIDEKQFKSYMALYKEMNKLQIDIIKGIANKFNSIIKDSEKIIELKEDVLNNYIKANTDRNYELLMNLKAFFPDLKKIHEWAAKIKSFTDNFNTNAEKTTNIFEEKEFSLPQFTILSSFNENKCIDTKNLNYGEFARVCDYQKDNKNQIFEMVKGTKEGYYSIRNHFSGFYLGIDSTNNGKKISLKKNWKLLKILN